MNAIAIAIADATPPAPPRFAVGQWVRYKKHFSPLFGRITETVACADGWKHLAECEVDGRVMGMWITDCDRVEVRAEPTPCGMRANTVACPTLDSHGYYQVADGSGTLPNSSR